MDESMNLQKQKIILQQEEIINRLKEGNKNFVKGRVELLNIEDQRKRVQEKQEPSVTILSCSDSRVIPEYIFNAQIGELFVIRTAGNVVDSVALGSIEYGVDHLKTPLLLILGHEKCGAVTAACSGSEVHGNIEGIVNFIKPACMQASWNVEEAIKKNLELIEKTILEESKIVRSLVEKGELNIIKAKYSLLTGKVIFY